MKSILIATLLLFSQLTFANNEVGGVEPTPTIEGIGPEQQMVLVESLRDDIKEIKTDLENATTELKDGKLYYNIGNVGIYLTGIVGFASTFFLRFKSTGTFREKIRKTSFIKNPKDGNCFVDLVTEVFDAKISKYEKKLRSRGRFLKFRKYTETDVDDAVKRYRADLRVDMTLTENEIDQKAKEFRKRKMIAWWTFIGGVTTFTGAAVLKNSTLDTNRISEKTKRDLEEALEKKERELHILEQTLHQFANHTNP